jgi:Ca2+-binding RTX toxin-like protein
MKRRIALFVFAGALALLVAVGVAFAATVNCQGGLVVCVGTDGPDKLLGTDGSDEMNGLQGDDVLRGLSGRDKLIGDRQEHPYDPPTGTTSSTATGAATFCRAGGPTC